MKTLLTAAAATIAMTGFAHAATIDIQGFIDDGYGERGVQDGTMLTVDGLDIVFSAENGFAYFDRGRAGVGACAVLNAQAQCVPSSDDNVTEGESVTLAFDGPFDLTGLVFRDANHDVLGTATGDLVDLRFTDVDGLTKSYAYEIGTTLALTAIESITLGYNNQQFYLSAFGATEFGGGTFDNVGEVPLPAAGFLFAGGIAAMSAVRRRRAA